MTRLVLFDIDGTLIRTGGAGVHAFGRTAELLYGVAGVAERTHFHGRTDTALVREFFLSNGLQGRSWDIRHFLDAYVFLLDHRLQENRGEICPGVPQFIQALKQLTEPPTLGLLTGNIRLGAKIKLGAHSLWGDWTCGAFADDHDDRNQLARIRVSSDAVSKVPRYWSSAILTETSNAPKPSEPRALGFALAVVRQTNSVRLGPLGW